MQFVRYIKKGNIMYRLILLITGFAILSACNQKNTLIDEYGEVCQRKKEILSPKGYDINTIGEIDFNGSGRMFQFVDEQTGYALLSNSVGGYVEIFKSINGGEDWEDLNIGIDQNPVGMVFRNENIGVITLHDVTGCPPPNCQHKCVLLKTVDGGTSWTQHEIAELKGILYQPQYDEDGNLYALLTFDDQTTLMKSTDDGETWDELFNSSELGFTLSTNSYKLFDDRFYISGKEGQVVVVDKNGELLKTIALENSHIWDIEVVDQDNIIIATSDKTIKTTDGGKTWKTITSGGARIIGFDSADNGIMLLRKSVCPTDVYQVNNVIAHTNDGGLNWVEGEETTTNLRSNFQHSQKSMSGSWIVMVGKKLMELKEE